MATIPAPLAKLGQTVRGFSMAQRTIALIGVAVLALGTVALVTFASQPKLAPLFTGLSAEDASGIVEQLKADSIPYELTGSGGTILVPEENVYDSRLKAAAAGLPSAGTSGYSLLDEMGVTSSEFQQSITYKRALEGELASTIGAMDGITMASVKLAIPEQTVFVDAVTDPTASIFVQTKPGTTLGTNQVQAIGHLTASAVDGLKPEDVSVVDAAGNLLSTAGAGVDGGAEQQSADYEARMAGIVQQMLDKVVGPGRASVAVAADVSLESAERTEETFTKPDGNPALTESSQEEEYEGSGGAGAGVLGPDNIAVPDSSSGEGSFNSSQKERTNAVNKVTENRMIPSGVLNRQSVSVVLDESVARGLDIEDLTAMVSAAAGIDAERNDSVNVSVLPFNTDAATAAQDALNQAADAADAERAAQLLRTLVIGGAVVLVVVAIVVALLLARRGKQRRELVDLGELHQMTPLPAVSVEGLGSETVTLSQIPAAQSTTSAPAAPQRSKREELSALAANDPAKLAEHLRAVMDEKGEI